VVLKLFDSRHKKAGQPWHTNIKSLKFASMPQASFWYCPNLVQEKVSCPIFPLLNLQRFLDMNLTGLSSLSTSKFCCQIYVCQGASLRVKKFHMTHILGLNFWHICDFLVAYFCDAKHGLRKTVKNRTLQKSSKKKSQENSQSSLTSPPIEPLNKRFLIQSKNFLAWSHSHKKWSGKIFILWQIIFYLRGKIKIIKNCQLHIFPEKLTEKTKINYE
jgi:hypothetical protein